MTFAYRSALHPSKMIMGKLLLSLSCKAPGVKFLRFRESTYFTDMKASLLNDSSMEKHLVRGSPVLPLLFGYVFLRN